MKSTGTVLYYRYRYCTGTGTKNTVPDLKNQLDTLIYSTEKSLGQYREKLDEADVSALESAMESARSTLNEHGDDKDKLAEATEALTTAAHKLAEAMYQSAGPDGDGASARAASDGAATDNEAGETAADDDVVDAEFVDADDKSKS